MAGGIALLSLWTALCTPLAGQNMANWGMVPMSKFVVAIFEAGHDMDE